jgi:hypothetical protein
MNGTENWERPDNGLTESIAALRARMQRSSTAYWQPLFSPYAAHAEPILTMPVTIGHHIVRM